MGDARARLRVIMVFLRLALVLACGLGCGLGHVPTPPMEGPPPSATRAQEFTLAGGDGLAMRAWHFLPQGTTPSAVALILPGGRGAPEVGKVWRHHLVFAEQLAQHGFAALVLDYHSPRRAFLDPRTVADVGAAIEWLKGQPEAPGQQIFLIGFSMGGANALRVAAARSDVAGLVTYFAPFDLGSDDDDQAARLSCPVLILQGGRDEITAPDQARHAAQVLTAKGKHVELVIYPRAGHGFTYLGAPLGKCCNYDAAVAARALDAVIAFMRSR